MSEEKKPLKALFVDNPETPEGKYLVKRRDGTVVEWPSFVLGARDPNGPDTLRFYGLLNLVPTEVREVLLRDLHFKIHEWLAHQYGQNKQYMESILRNAGKWEEYRRQHGEGDPLMGKHRQDDPATIAEMRKGMSS